MDKLQSRARRIRHSIAALSAGALAALLWAAAAAAAGVETSTAAGHESEMIDEIIVTAQRREETLQKSSVSVQVVTGAALERAGVTQATDLNRIAPGVQIGTGGNATQIYIRGIGDFAVSALSNPAVAFNVDGVYVARPQGTNSEFYDVDRVEILKGPQGTLYGRNATGGAINVITRKPSLDGMDGRISVDLGNYDLKHVEGALNVPLSATVAIRGAFNIVDRTGYLSDGTDDDVRQAARVNLLWKPSDVFSALLSADYAHEGGHGPGYVMLPRPPGTGPWVSASSASANAILNSTPPLGFLVPPVAAGQLSRQSILECERRAQLESGICHPDRAAGVSRCDLERTQLSGRLAQHHSRGDFACLEHGGAPVQQHGSPEVGCGPVLHQGRPEGRAADL